MQDIEELLAKEGLHPGEPFAGADQHMGGQLPLAIFDDTEYESRNPDGWVSKDPGAPPAPGRVAMPSSNGSFAFQDCTVVDYNQQHNSFLVQLTSGRNVSGKQTCKFAETTSIRGSARCESLMHAMQSSTLLSCIQCLKSICHHQNSPCCSAVLPHTCCSLYHSYSTLALHESVTLAMQVQMLMTSQLSIGYPASGCTSCLRTPPSMQKG